MDDTISRQAALEKVRAMQTYKLFMGDDMILVDKAEVQTELMMQPSVHPEPQEGEWIRNDNGTYSCNLCHSWIPGEQYFYARYCLYCGAKMKGVENG